MSGLYDIQSDEELRAAVVALCVEMGKRYTSNTTRSLTAAAERIVPRVPTPEPEYHTHKGVTYMNDRWWAFGTSYDSASALIADQWSTFTDDDHAALMLIKKYPTKPVQWDGTADEANRLFGDAYGVDWVYASNNPVGYANIYPNGIVTYPSAEIARAQAGAKALDTEVPLYRHPATEAEALAVLVSKGWKSSVSRYAVVDADGYHNRRVLIAPEGK